MLNNLIIIFSKLFELVHKLYYEVLIENNDELRINE